MHWLLKDSGKLLMLGNHAIVRGALESGVGFASTYPGTPASEIGDSFAQLARQFGLYFEYSTNEKVATEAAAAAAASGVRSIVSFKHFGFNVASDSVYPLAWFGIKAGMVIVFADDPSCHSSGQSEQDSRYLARIAHMPLLEPASPQECKDYTKFAFELSEKIGTPVIIRLTTRVSHCGAPVELGKLIKPKLRGQFPKDRAWNTMPPQIIQRHAQLHDGLERALQLAKSLNKVNESGSEIGIIGSGVAYLHAAEAARMLGLELSMLKLGITWPLDEDLIRRFAAGKKAVLVAEEVEPILASEIARILGAPSPPLKPLPSQKNIGACARGAPHPPLKPLPNQKNIGAERSGEPSPPLVKSRKERAGESNPAQFARVLAELTGKTFQLSTRKLDLPRRPPVLCPGCPHRATFWAAKTAAPDAVFSGDIGCYIIGIYPPQQEQHFIISMGADQGFSHGIRKCTDQTVISFIGDSTFFHAGIPGLINSVYNKSDYLTLVLDNRITAMTGHQPHPGTGITGMGDSTKELKIEEIAAACGVDHVDVVNPYNVKELSKKIKEYLQKPGTKLIVCKGECRLKFMRRMRKQGIKVPVFEIDQNKCTKCGKCIFEFGCPAIHKNNEYYIDEDFCWGCGVCAQICPAGAIRVKK